MKRKILDAGAFIENLYTEGITSESVAEETKVPPTVEILSPKTKFIKKIRLAAKETGDLDVLSKADLDILALGLEMKGTIVSNDFSVQNVAEHLKMPWEGAGKSITKKINWIWYCPGCKKLQNTKGECEFCGTETKRRPKGPRNRKNDKTLRKHL